MTRLRRGDGWAVVPVGRAVAAGLVERLHYAGGASNTGLAFHALVRDGRALGVAWWLPPTKPAAVASAPDGMDWRSVASLSRLVVDPSVPTNGASFLLGRSIRLLRGGPWRCLVTYADTWRGHTGAIYRATNWEYLGLTKPSPVWVDGEGRLVARKRGPVTLTKEQMIERGYEFVGYFPKHKFRKVIR